MSYAERWWRRNSVLQSERNPSLVYINDLRPRDGHSTSDSREFGVCVSYKRSAARDADDTSGEEAT